MQGGARASFAAFAATQPETVGLAVAPLNGTSVQTLGSNAAEHGWSTTKVLVLAALLRARGRVGLTAAERSEAQLAITASDNQSVLALFRDLESLKGGLVPASQAMQQLLRAAGDDSTTVSTDPPPAGAVTTFGQTGWAPSEAVKFIKALGQGRLLPAAQSGYVLGLMEHVIPSESWGLGAASFGVPVAFKGGWGPESGGYVVRQSGVVDPGTSRGVAVAIVASGGSFASGTRVVSATAAWLAHELVRK